MILSGSRAAAQGGGEAQVEAGVVDEHHRRRLQALDLRQHAGELRAEIAVFLEHFPQPDHGGLLGPILHVLPGHGAHPRAAAAVEASGPAAARAGPPGAPRRGRRR